MENANVANNARILAAEKSERQASAGVAEPTYGRINALEAKLNRVEAALHALQLDGEALGTEIGRHLREALAKTAARIDALEARPSIKYLGIHKPGATYTEGSMVTRDGSIFYAHKTTRESPGDGCADWQLAVKHGRDAKDATK